MLQAVPARRRRRQTMWSQTDCLFPLPWQWVTHKQLCVKSPCVHPNVDERAVLVICLNAEKVTHKHIQYIMSYSALVLMNSDGDLVIILTQKLLTLWHSDCYLCAHRTNTLLYIVPGEERRSCFFQIIWVTESMHITAAFLQSFNKDTKLCCWYTQHK